MASSRPLGPKSFNSLPSITPGAGNKWQIHGAARFKAAKAARDSTEAIAALMEGFVRDWQITADEAQKQQLVDGVPGPFKHVALAYRSVRHPGGDRPLFIASAYL